MLFIKYIFVLLITVLFSFNSNAALREEAEAADSATPSLKHPSLKGGLNDAAWGDLISFMTVGLHGWNRTSPREQVQVDEIVQGFCDFQRTYTYLNKLKGDFLQQDLTRLSFEEKFKSFVASYQIAFAGYVKSRTSFSSHTGVELHGVLDSNTLDRKRHDAIYPKEIQPFAQVLDIISAKSINWLRTIIPLLPSSRDNIHLFPRGLGYLEIADKITAFCYKASEEHESVTLLWGADAPTHTILFEGNAPWTNTGIYIRRGQIDTFPTLEVRLYYGADSSPSPYTFYPASIHVPVYEAVLYKQLPLVQDLHRLLTETSQSQLFIPFPTKKEEKAILEVLLLEDMREESATTATSAAAAAVASVSRGDEISSLPSLIERTLQTSLKDLLAESEKTAREAYELSIREQQEYISQHVPLRYEEESAQRQQKRDQKKQARKVSKSKSGPQAAAAGPAAQLPLRVDSTPSIPFEDFKSRMRIKTASLRRALNSILREAHRQQVPLREIIASTQRGSHLVVRGGERGAPTLLVRPHGRRDTSMPARFATPVISVVQAAFLELLNKRESSS